MVIGKFYREESMAPFCFCGTDSSGWDVRAWFYNDNSAGVEVVIGNGACVEIEQPVLNPLIIRYIYLGLYYYARK